jgi:hypothetical protein
MAEMNTLPTSPNPLGTFGRMTGFVLNYISSRLSWLNRTVEGDRRRSIEDECGHRKTFPTAEEYHLLYQRDPIAARVVEVFPKECWQVQPRVYEREDPGSLTQFERDWKDLGMSLNPEEGYYQDERGSLIWEALKRVDELCGIGRYGVLFLGIDDGKPLDQPVDRNRKNKLNYVTPLSEVHARILTSEMDMASKRFGHPTQYELTFSNPQEGDQQFDSTMNGSPFKVHWDRVVHVIDNPLESIIFGVPRMQQVIDRIDDLRKLYGGSAEMYWKGAFPGLAFEGHPNAPQGGFDLEGLKDMAEDYQNGLQRILAVLNMTVKSMSPQVKDPSPQIMRQIEAICIKLPCPKRVFMGSERGELASNQDDAKWNDQLRERHYGHCTPRIVVPMVTRLINLNVLSKPKGFSVSWPDLTSQTPEEKASVTFKNTQSLTQFVQGDGRTLMTDLDYLTSQMGMDEAQAMSIIENRKREPLDPAQTNATKPKVTVPVALPVPNPPGKNPNGQAASQANGK